MRTISMLNWMSLDGRFAQAGDATSMDWTVQDPETSAAIFGDGPRPGDEPGTLLLGRVTFEGLKRSWTPYLNQPDAPEMMRGFAHALTGMRKIVFSSTTTEDDWANTEFHAGDLVERATALRAGEGGPIMVMGSGTVVRALTDAGLIDEYTVILTPVLLGQGKELFGGVESRRLRLTSSRAFDSGNLILRYVPA